MRKIYYIPTSSLNFNNILSSESISPSAFYSHRNFGYKRWTQIAENGLENVILLYDDLRYFSRPDNGLEDHPLVVAVVLDEENLVKCGSNVYYCDHTVYLDPWYTRFIFFTEQDKRTALSMSDSSSETKLISLYRKGIIVRQPNSSQSYEIPSLDNVSLNMVYIDSDFRINRIKGMLYGYYIGANSSLNKEAVKELVDLREVFNILTSILSSDSHMPTDIQRERLYTLLGINENSLFYSLYDSLIIGMISDGSMQKRVQSLLNKVELSSLSKRTLLSTDKSEIVFVSGEVDSILPIADETEKNIFKSWTHYLSSSESIQFNGKLSAINKDLADVLTRLAKSVCGDNWEGSEERRFLNNIRHHLNGEPFEEAWDNGLLSSLAAVLTNGDDWHKLLKFMQSKGMYDYRLAFAFYGMLNGFANLTRDFTDNLFDVKDRKYVAEVYKEFYKQLFGETFDTTSISAPVNQIQEEITQPEVLPSGLAHEYSNSDNNDNPNDSSTNPFPERVRNIFSSVIKNKPRIKHKDELEKKLEQAIEKNGGNEVPSRFLRILEALGWKKTNQPYLLMKDGLEPDKEGKGRNRKIEVSSPDLFSLQEKPHDKTNIVRSTMFNDHSWWKITANMISDKKSQERYLIDVEWFVGNHKEIYVDPKSRKRSKGVYFGHDLSNPSFLNRFKNYLDNKLHPRNPKANWLIHYYQNVPIDKIISYLGGKYGV